MRSVLNFFLKSVRLLAGLAIAGGALVSTGAFLGFASPLLDAFNHLQPLLFSGTLGLLLLSLLLFRVQPLRGGMIALAATGFLASAVTVLPEQAGGWLIDTRPRGEAPPIRIMSHNLFGLNYDMDRMARVIEREAPDIIALQEYFSEQQGPLHPRIVQDYPYFNLCAGRKHSYIALYSRTPFSVLEESQCAADASQNDNPAARIVAAMTDEAGTPFTLIITHLNWPVQINPLFRDEMSLADRLAAMTARKQGEWRELGALINSLEGPVVLAGDFNSTSWSYAMRRFTAEAGLTRYSRGLLTYPKLLYIRGWRETPAFLPIDHIMGNDAIVLHEIRAGAKTGSDHLPLFAEISIVP